MFPVTRPLIRVDPCPSVVKNWFALIREIRVKSSLLFLPWLFNSGSQFFIRVHPCPSVVDELCVFVALLFNFRVWPSARPENDRKTTGFTKPLRPESNLGKE
jgi:hypothetical protein